MNNGQRQFQFYNSRAKMMKIITVLLTLLAVSFKCLRAETEIHTTGPVTAVIQNLAYNTATINDEISLQLNSNIERTSNLMLGDIEVILAAALDQLADPLFEANKQLQGSKCAQAWNMKELMSRIDEQLTACTNELTEVLTVFQQDAGAIAKTVQSSVQDIASLPMACELNDKNALALQENTFAGHSRCFVERIADINRELSMQLNRAGVLFARVRQQSKQSVSSASQCTQNVVDQTLQFLTKTLQECL